VGAWPEAALRIELSLLVASYPKSHLLSQEFSGQSDDEFAALIIVDSLPIWL
jgi:hypothetical protein